MVAAEVVKAVVAIHWPWVCGQARHGWPIRSVGSETGLWDYRSSRVSL